MADMIRVLYKEPGKAPEVRVIKNELKEFQQLVKGYIEDFPFPRPIRISSKVRAFVNEEGRINGMKYNCMGVYGPVVFFEVGYDGECCDIHAEDICILRRCIAMEG